MRQPTPAGASTDFHLMAKPSGALCNLDCSYCFYLEKEALYAQDASRFRMRDDVLARYTRDYIASQAGREVTFAWQGGEPTLLGLDFFRQAVALQREHAGDKVVTNTIQTNGTLLDDAWGEFLAAERVLVGVSIDGPQAVHDAYRVDKGGHPTWDRVMRGIEVLQRHGVAFNTLTCVHRRNEQSPLEVYRFLREIGHGHMQFIPIAERHLMRDAARHMLAPPAFEGNAQVTDWSVRPEAFGRFLCRVFDEWVRHDVGQVFVQHFDVALQRWMGLPPSLCVFAETCGAALALEHNGDVYACDHYVDPAHRLGNIMRDSLGTLVRADAQVRFGAAKRDALPAYCRACDVRFACNGECPKHRFAHAPDGAAGLNYLCAGFKVFFHHIAPHMAFMTEQLRRGLAPAAVMPWAVARDAELVASASGRNGPCPCGSGRKYKRCCGAAA